MNTFVKQHRAASDTDYESWRQDEITPTLNAMDNTTDTFATVLITDEAIPVALRGRDGNQIEHGEPGDPAYALRAAQGGSSTPLVASPVAFNWQNGGGYGNANDGLAITHDGVGPLSTSQVPAVSITGTTTHPLTSEGADASEDGTGRGTPIVTDTRYTVRRLTPTECERLQGFPDDWTLVPGPKGKPQSDSQRYRQLGNAITVNVAHYIGCLLIDADERTER